MRVFLEPEWNVAPPAGETAIIDWPWFGNDLRAAMMMLRREAPNVLVGSVALSGHVGWERRPRDILRDLLARERQLREAGVFGRRPR